MNENINLCEILKGHEGEMFYSPLYGNIKLKFILFQGFTYPLHFIDKFGSEVSFDKYGYPNRNATECLVFPTKSQRNWNKWDKENNYKVPKTWNELCKKGKTKVMVADPYIAGGNISIIESAKALLKIHQLIEVSYGGNVTNKEWRNNKLKKWYLVPNSPDDENNLFLIVHGVGYYKKRNIAFHTYEQAEEFLSYPENVQLLRDYFQVN